jgi:hypothetical protein
MRDDAKMLQVSDENGTGPVRIVAGWIGRRSEASNSRCLPWFSPQAYSRLRAALKDPVDFPSDYEHWRKLSEAAERQWIDRGATVLRGSVNPEAFMAWCKKRFVKPNRKAVEFFVEEMTFGREVVLLGSDTGFDDKRRRPLPQSFDLGHDGKA